jgi:hypothetical protein
MQPAGGGGPPGGGGGGGYAAMYAAMECRHRFGMSEQAWWKHVPLRHFHAGSALPSIQGRKEQVADQLQYNGGHRSVHTFSCYTGMYACDIVPLVKSTHGANALQHGSQITSSEPGDCQPIRAQMRAARLFVNASRNSKAVHGPQVACPVACFKFMKAPDAAAAVVKPCRCNATNWC